jgi:iron complex outermembrane receptor protein
MVVYRAFVSTLTAATLLAVSAGPVAAQDSPSAASGSLDELDSIVVTARRREESILETPLAITAVTSEDLEAKGITSFNQLAESTPGINLSNASAGAARSDRSFQQITLRGMVPSSTQSTLTATFIDGVPVASPAAIASVGDPARIEILKGPQAAYFGRNTFAGAINVVNKDPGDVFGGSLLLMGGNRSNIDFTGSVHGPLGEKFGFRLNAKYFRKDGSYQNAANPGETLGDQQTQTLSLLLTAKPIENLSAKLFYLHSEDDDGAPAQGLISAYEMRANAGNVNFPAASGSSAGTILLENQSNCTLSGFTLGRLPNEARVSRPFICGAVPGLSARTPAQNTTLPADLLGNSVADPRLRMVSPANGAKDFGLVRKYQHAHLNIDYEFGDSGFTLSSLSGLNAEFYSQIQDLDNFDSRALSNTGPFGNPGGANPNLLLYWDFPFMVERETYDFSQELRLAYDKDGPFSGIFGVSYLKTTVWANLINLGGELRSVAGARLNSGSAGKNSVETKGAFFGATYNFTDALKVSLEGRYQEDYVVGRAAAPMGASVSAASAAAFGIPAGNYGPLAQLVDETYKEFLPRLIVQYDFTDDLMGYASYSKGVNVGVNTFNTAFLSLPPFAIQEAINLGLSVVQKPEKLTNYEIGFKGRLADGRIQFQSALYYAIWKDQLNNRSRTEPDRPIAQGGFGTNTALQITGFANTGETKLKGIELEVTAKLIDNLELGIAGAMNDSEIQSFSNPLVSQLSGIIGDGFSGKQLPLASKYSANLSAQYGTPISAWDDGSWFVRGDLSWKDKQFLNPANITWIEARTVVNFRAGITRGPLSVDAFVLNAFDDDNYVSGFQGGIIAPAVTPSGTAETYVIVGLPELRTYGLRLAYKF